MSLEEQWKFCKCKLCLLKLKIISFLISVVELSCLTITSKSMRNLVELYRNTDRAQKYLLPHPVVHSVIPATELQQACYDQFRKCGKLCFLKFYAHSRLPPLLLYVISLNCIWIAWLTTYIMWNMYASTDLLLILKDRFFYFQSVVNVCILLIMTACVID